MPLHKSLRTQYRPPTAPHTPLLQPSVFHFINYHNHQSLHHAFATFKASASFDSPEHSLPRSSRQFAHRRSTNASLPSSIHRHVRSESPHLQNSTRTSGFLHSIVYDAITTHDNPLARPFPRSAPPR
ncbi:hypothetical protein BDN70DRAFT_519632 [Pholiota conissans]|uniref:Uncharacterized protein n=1 Tax=Pholiota conissans TaxID=109636 RepID=A0A9P5YNQ7_9AGAR|nr:hypothetical protein BDN70DRAFT_519632 [Pholiota conissans]